MHIDLDSLSDDELSDLLDRVVCECEIRFCIANAPAQVTQIVAAAASLGVAPDVIRAATEAGIDQAGDPA